jgi:HEAT repeat protein
MNNRHSIRHLVATFLGTIVFSTGVAPAQDNVRKSERDLIATLRSDAPDAEKAVTCKYLALYGTSEAVPELAKLLSNEKLNSWARIALEAIPGSAADEALRQASDSLQGRQLVGVINSIGVRRDGAAIERLAKRLSDKDVDVASAAAAALGHIGNAAAAQRLEKALAGAPITVRSAIAEGLILCAERFTEEGKKSDAVKIYDLVRKAEVPAQRMLEATRGAILARGAEGIPLLVEQLRSSDKGLFQIALSTAREFPGRDIDKALADELTRAVPERGALVITAMADRKETVDRVAIQKAASNGPTLIRVAAINALGRVGDAQSLAPLLEIATDSDQDIAQAAKEALAELPGQAVDKEIVARLDQAQGKAYPLLIELVGMRRIEATAPLLKALNNSDSAIRTAALTALGNTISEKQLPVLINQVVSPASQETAAAAKTALKTAAVRMPDREACAAELAAAMNRAPAATKPVLLETLAAIGGAKALQAIGAAAKSPDANLQDVSTRLLGEWMTTDAAPVLLDLSKTSERYAGRAIRGYIRIVRQFGTTMTDEQRVEICKNALDVARQPAEKKLVLEVLQRYPSVGMLKLAVKAAQTQAISDDANAAALAIAGKVGNNNEVREIMTKAGLKK